MVVISVNIYGVKITKKLRGFLMQLSVKTHVHEMILHCVLGIVHKHL